MSLSDVSDLTELSSEEDVPLSKRASDGKKKASKEYKITHVLRAPRTAQYTAKSLYDQIIDNSIDLDPEYQRDVVWQEEKQSGLIDSILRNYYIPPIIFAVTIQDDGSELRTCIDGKQRLTSIQRFIDGHIPHKDSFTSEKLWFKSTATIARRRLLPQHMKTLFTNKQIVCVEYTGLDNDQEREIFQRVQLGVALTPAERLQALVGPWSVTIREIQNQVLGDEGFEGYLDWGHARGRDFQCLATIGYLIENHPKTTVPGTKTLEKWLQKTEVVPSQLRADLHETFRIFVTLARDKKYSGSLNRPTRVSPIEFVTIGVLIYLKRKTLSLTQMSSAIEKMRKDVRASHQDIRSNTRVTKHLMEFMAKKIRVSDLKSDGNGDQPAALAVAKAVKPAKRKRPVDSDASDMELAPPKAKPTRPPGIKSAEASKSLKQPSSATQQKTSGAKRTPTVSLAKGSPSATPPQFTSSRNTNNSLSNIPVAREESPLLTPVVRSLHNPIPPLLPLSPNGHDALSRSIASNLGSRGPLSIQTGLALKVESSQMDSLSSPVPLSVVDRLAPIRAAKASLSSTSAAQSPMNQNSELRTMISPSTASQPPADPQQNLAPQATSQCAPEQPPPPSLQLPRFPSNPEQGHPIPAKVEGVLQALRAQFPQLYILAQNLDSDAADPATTIRNVQSLPGTASHSSVPLLIHGTHPGGSGHLVHPPHGMPDGNMTALHPNTGQAFRPYAIPMRSSSSLGTSGYMTPQHQQPTSNFPTSAGLHTLPQRPAVNPNFSSRPYRAEQFGPSSRSAFSHSVTQDSRRGSYSKDRHRHSDDGWSTRHNRNQDTDRDRRNRSRSRFQ